MRWILPFPLVLLLAIALASCGSTATDGTGAPRADEQRREAGAESTDPMQVAQEVAREVCAFSGQAKVAREFGVSSDDPATIAEVYAEEVSTTLFQPFSERGCLEGLTE